MGQGGGGSGGEGRGRARLECCGRHGLSWRAGPLAGGGTGFELYCSTPNVYFCLSTYVFGCAIVVGLRALRGGGSPVHDRTRPMVRPGW